MSSGRAHPVPVAACRPDPHPETTSQVGLPPVPSIAFVPAVDGHWSLATGRGSFGGSERALSNRVCWLRGSWYHQIPCPASSGALNSPSRALCSEGFPCLRLRARVLSTCRQSTVEVPSAIQGAWLIAHDGDQVALQQGMGVFYWHKPRQPDVRAREKAAAHLQIIQTQQVMVALFRWLPTGGQQPLAINLRRFAIVVVVIILVIALIWPGLLCRFVLKFEHMYHGQIRFR